MKTLAGTAIMLLIMVFSAEAGGLPWPSVAAGKLYLPFGLQWFMEGARDKIAAYGEPECHESGCRWMAERPEGTLFFLQAYHFGSLVGFRMEYMLKRDEGLDYRERLAELEKRLTDWVVTRSGDPLMSMLGRDRSFKAESKDTRMMAACHEGEHTITIILDFHAK